MLKNRLKYTVLLLLVLASCSRTTLTMKNNTWRTRTYHNMTSKYNIYFNGNEAFEDGLNKIKAKNEDDFTRVLPVFEDGIHANYRLAKADMEYAIEKSNKIIQLHSIKKKPKFNPKKAGNAKYRAWRNQEEFNKMIDDAYLMMGKANFYQGEFLSAIGVFNYVALKYSGEEAWYDAHLWIARSYIEMGWLYEAENMLALVNDENLPFTLLKDFNMISADLLIRRENYKEAAPYLNSALEGRLSKHEKQRLRDILAQIYQQVGEDEQAYDLYRKFVRSIPSYEMEFYARIRMSEVIGSNNTDKAEKKLKRMLKDPKNLEYKGQIYYALGNLYSAQGAALSAIENYRLSLEMSEGVQKGLTAKTIAELYYGEKGYYKAADYYEQAAGNLPEDYPDYYEIERRAEVLAQLKSYYDEVGDMDREYRLSQMSDQEKDAFLDKEAREAEIEARIQNLLKDANEENQEELALEEQRSEKVGDWYFFNPNLVEKGRAEFEKQWGERAFKDNWRRSMAPSFMENNDLFAEEENNDTQEGELTEQADTIVTEDDDSEQAKIIEEQQRAANNKSAVEAYYNLATLYQFDIADMEEAIITYEALESLFPSNPHSADSYFSIYQSATAIKETPKANNAKTKLLALYPNSNYALILTDPNAHELLIKDKKEYNNLYASTFNDFLKGKNLKVLNNIQELKTGFRDSSLMSKVLFMEALATAKTDYKADIRPQLERITDNYASDTAVYEQAKHILSQLEAGKKISLGGSGANTLSERRNEEARIQREKILSTQKYAKDDESRHYLILVLPDSLNINKNHLQYDVARFNFNKFMTMDFELSFGKLNEQTSLMIINGFSNKEEGLWYRNEFMATNILDTYSAIKKWYIISEENFRLLLLLQTLEEYEDFDRKVN